MFNHVELNLCPLERENIDGARYYKIPDFEEYVKLVSITSIISHINREFFDNWRKRVGVAEADKITRQATSRGTDMHTLCECHLMNRDLPPVQPLSEYLFKQAKPQLSQIDNIHAIEGPLYSRYLGVAGTVDCIGEYNGELAIIDFKTSKKPKKREWIDGYFVQCAAYACMLHEMKDIQVKKFVIIMSCENGEVEVYEEYDKKRYIKLLDKYIRKYINDKLKEYATT